MNERMLSPRELAAQLHVSLATVNRMVARGELRVHRVGKAPRFLWSEIVEDTAEEPVSMARAIRRI